MTDTLAHAPGTFCWFELATGDQAAATRFYADLFGWQHHDDPMGEDAVYTMLRHGGRDVGGLYTLNEQQRSMNVPPHWMPYVAVEDAAAVAGAARARGGTVVVEPMDVYDMGCMAVLQDPTGAAVSIWQARAFPGVGLRDAPGAVCWNELATPDAEAAGSFYRDVFAYALDLRDVGTGPYTVFTRDGHERAGMMEMTPEWGDVPPHWMTYFAVADCDQAAARAAELGANVCVPPTDIPDVGRFAVIDDPQGATFSVLAMT